MAITITIYWKKIKWVKVWNFKMNGVYASSLKYINNTKLGIFALAVMKL